MANLEVAKTCPRKAVLDAMPAGINKYSQLRHIMKEVVMGALPQTKEADLLAKIDEEFDNNTSSMKPFERDSEKLRMITLIKRYYAYETGPFKILAQEQSVKVKFAGKDHTVLIHRLMDRGNGQLEAIAYSYKAPQVSVRSRKSPTKKSLRLLLLQLAGEKLAKDMKLQGVTVFGAVYSMKSSLDTSHIIVPEFETNAGANIARYHFDPMERGEMERTFATIVATTAIEAHDQRDCQYCVHFDLCHTEFKKRKLEEVEDVEISPINKIKMTKAQRTLVEFENGICRTDAVAGSGKTTIVTLRTLRMLDLGVEGSHILMITFTEKAAKELRDRLSAYRHGTALKNSGIDTDDVIVQTFNGWGNEILNEHYKVLGFTEKPELIDDVVKKDIILDILDQYRDLPMDYRNPFLNMINAKGCVIETVQLIDAMKAAHVETADDVKELVGPTFSGHFDELLEMYQKYNATLVQQNKIDYEDQLRLILQLEKHGVFKKLPYEHLVVDEFQDSNPNQIDLIRRIVEQAPNFKSLVVIGDTMQAIYGFRNASPENLNNFDKIFPNVVDINLEDNFRSQKPIIQVANRILEKESKMKIAIKAHRKEHGLDPVLMNIEKQPDEINLYVKQAKSLIARGHDPASIAVLCRTRGELVKVQEAMSAAGIPTMLRVPEIMGDAPYVKAIIALASFFKDPDKMEDLAFFAKSLGQDPFNEQLLEQSKTVLLDNLAKQSTETDRIEYFFDLCQDASEDYVANDFLEELRSKKFKALNALINYCVKYKEYGTKEPHPTNHEEANAVSLITVHSSKGLEWPTVLLSLRRFRLDSEERRLLYVAVTRAKDRLLITYTEKQQILVDLLSETI